MLIPFVEYSKFLYKHCLNALMQPPKLQLRKLAVPIQFFKKGATEVITPSQMHKAHVSFELNKSMIKKLEVIKIIKATPKLAA